MEYQEDIKEEKEVKDIYSEVYDKLSVRYVVPEDFAKKPVYDFF